MSNTTTLPTATSTLAADFTSTILGGALPTTFPDDCETQELTHPKDNHAGCAFLPVDKDISQYKHCCGDQPIIEFGPNCGNYACHAKSNDPKDLQALTYCLRFQTGTNILQMGCVPGENSESSNSTMVSSTFTTTATATPTPSGHKSAAGMKQAPQPFVTVTGAFTFALLAVGSLSGALLL